MPDYSNGKIYIIRSPNTQEVYIGSTIQSLSQRMAEHRTKFNLWKNHGTTSIKIFEAGNAYIELVQEYPCQNKEQLNRREGEIMRQTENCVNKLIAGQTKKEWSETNKDYLKEYREANKFIISEKKKKYREANKDSILAKKKEYYEANKAVLSEKMREYYENNKEKIKTYNSKLFVCECGAEITTGEISRHLKSKKHTDKLLILKD